MKDASSVLGETRREGETDRRTERQTETDRDRERDVRMSMGV